MWGRQVRLMTGNEAIPSIFGNNMPCLLKSSTIPGIFSLVIQRWQGGTFSEIWLSNGSCLLLKYSLFQFLSFNFKDSSEQKEPQYRFKQPTQSQVHTVVQGGPCNLKLVTVYMPHHSHINWKVWRLPSHLTFRNIYSICRHHLNYKIKYDIN